MVNESLGSKLIFAQKGDTQAQYECGLKYLNGEQGQVDIDRAEYWFLQAANKGHAQSQAAMGFILDQYPEKSEQACQWYKQGAKNQNAEAQYRLAIHLLTGHGVAKDKIEARVWLERAKKQDHIDAHLLLIWQMLSDCEFTHDPGAAATELLVLAEKGNELAQLILAHQLNAGQGVVKDPVSAMVLLDAVVDKIPGQDELLSVIENEMSPTSSLHAQSRLAIGIQGIELNKAHYFNEPLSRAAVLSNNYQLFSYPQLCNDFECAWLIHNYMDQYQSHSSVIRAATGRVGQPGKTGGVCSLPKKSCEPIIEEICHRIHLLTQSHPKQLSGLQVIHLRKGEKWVGQLNADHLQDVLIPINFSLEGLVIQLSSGPTTYRCQYKDALLINMRPTMASVNSLCAQSKDLFFLHASIRELNNG